MPYEAPKQTLAPSSLAAAASYPTPPPSPLQIDEAALPAEEDLFWTQPACPDPFLVAAASVATAKHQQQKPSRPSSSAYSSSSSSSPVPAATYPSSLFRRPLTHLRPPSRAFSRATLPLPPPRHRVIRRTPSLPVQLLLSTSQDLPHSAALRLSPPRGILAVLGGVRVLRIDAGSALDHMPYTSYTAATMGVTEAADTDTVDAILASERKADAVAADIDSGSLSLRRAVSETAVVEPSASAVAVAVAVAAALPTRSQSTPSPGSICVQPPTPTRSPAPAGAGATTASPVVDSNEHATSPSSSSSSHPAPTPTLPRTSPRASPSTRAPARLSSRSSSSSSSSSSSVRLPSALPSSPSSLGITINANVLPEVRSPRRNPETLSLQNRRSRRPRVFGFTGIGNESATSSVNHSPDMPSSPLDAMLSNSSSTGASTAASMLPRRSPARTRSDSSLSTLPHATSRLQRRDTGLKLDLANLIPKASDHQAPMTASGVVSSPYRSVVKKKSGEIVKPALKVGGPLLPNGTPVDRDDDRSRQFAGSRSCPTTPSCPKYVHFDSQLERVKLFMHDQKPLVVSRQGSPTDELSDPEDDKDKLLHISLPNFPTSHAPDADIYLESLFLNEARDSLRGHVVVRNISFAKWVAVRFTFDWWQTTSEVTASYKDSLPGGTHDRFAFTVKLENLLETIQTKTLFLCIRYTTDGREIWDSNGGENYKVLFERKAPEGARYMSKRAPSVATKGLGGAVTRNSSQWSVTGSDADRMADLRAKLNRLTAEDRELNKPISPKRGGTLGSMSPRSSPRASPNNTLWPLPDTAKERPGVRSFASRYDIGTAIKASRDSSPTLRGNKDLPPVRAHAATEFYSPRLGTLGLPVSPSPLSPNPSPPPAGPASPAGPPSPTSPLAANEPSTPVMSAPPALQASANSSSTSSLSSVTSVTRTPADSPQLPVGRVFRDHRIDHDSSSTPSDTTESATQSPSPLSLPSDSPVSPSDVLPWSPMGKNRSVDDMSLASYSTFIEQFCWGGADPHKAVSFNPAPPSSNAADVRRVQSASSLDHYFSSPPDALTPRAYTPTYNLSRSASQTGASVTPREFGRKGSPPTREDLEHVDSAIRSLSSSLSNSLATTPAEGTPSPVLTPPVMGLSVMAA